MRLLKLALSTVGICFLLLFAILSVRSSRESRREHDKQRAIQDFDYQQTLQAAAQEPERRKRYAEFSAKVDAEVENLKSPDREVLNQAIQRLQRFRECRAAPPLLDVLRETQDDAIAGVAAEAVAQCAKIGLADPMSQTIYETVTEQFMNRKPTPGMLMAVANIDKIDDRAYEKVSTLAEDSSQKTEITSYARRAKQQIDVRTQRKSK